MSSRLDGRGTTLQDSHACSSEDMQAAVSSYTFLPDHLIEVLVPYRRESIAVCNHNSLTARVQSCCGIDIE